MGILGAKCEGCWERIEDCTCGKYKKEQIEVVTFDEVYALRKQLRELTAKVNALLEKLS